METSHSRVTGREVERLLVRPRDAWQMLGCGNTHGYALLKAGELESFLDGRARKITTASIHSYIAKKLAEATNTSSPRRRGQQRTGVTAHAS
jgi:hypothetical protein